MDRDENSEVKSVVPYFCPECHGGTYAAAIIGTTALHVRVRHHPMCLRWAAIQQRFPALMAMRKPER